MTLGVDEIWLEVAPLRGEARERKLEELCAGDPSLAVRAGLSPPVRVVAEDPELPAWLVELPHLPRAYVARDVLPATADDALAFAVAGGSDGRTVVEDQVSTDRASGGDARVVRDDPGHTVVEALADGRALVVLNDAFAPGWTATVDGAPARIVRANGLVRGVWIGAGAHTVAFRYRAPGLALGWAIALLLALALGAWALVRRGAIRRSAVLAARGAAAPN